MKKLYLSLFCVCLFSFCKSQNEEFTSYINEFRLTSPDFMIDNSTFRELFSFNGQYKEISLQAVNKYICFKPLCNDENIFRFDFGVLVDLETEDFFAVIVRKLQFDELHGCDNDLSELLLITYSKKGGKIDIQQIGKDNDCWISHTKFFGNKILVEQIRILEFNKPEMSCEIEVKKYLINQNGIIDNIHSEPIREGIVVWDEQIEEFRLK